MSHGKSDDLFRKARRGEIKAQIFFIASIFFFVIGVVSSLLMWVGIERIAAMEEPTFIIKLLDVLAWPAAVVLGVLVLRKPILTLYRKMAAWQWRS